MANKNLSLFLTVFACTAIFGCNNGAKDEDRYTMKSPYYVQTYIAANDFDLKAVEGNGNYIVGIFFKGERISILPPADKVRFEELAEAFGDGSYTGTVLPDANKALADALSSVSVVCDKEYDAAHEAGSSLDDLVTFCATSPYEFIRGGYKDTVRNDDYPEYFKEMAMNQDVGYKPVEMPVGAVNKNNSSMLYPICHLYFKRRPAQDGEYVFTITVKTEDMEIVKKIAHRF